MAEEVFGDRKISVSFACARFWFNFLECLPADTVEWAVALTVAKPHPNGVLTEEEIAFRVSRDPDRLAEVDAAGRTLLHLAANAGKAAVCRIYLNAGLDPLAKEQSGRTAADLARHAGYSALAKSLDAFVPAFPQRHSAVASPEQLDAREQRALIAGDLEFVKQIIATGRLNTRNAKGDTPLHLAAAGGHLLVCNQIFAAGGDSALRNDRSQTPADMAAEAGHSRLAELPRDLSPSDDTVEAVSGQEDEHLLSHYAGPSFQGEVLLDLLDFEGEESAGTFHDRQAIQSVSAHFIALPAGSAIRDGNAAETDEWDLPDGLAKVRPVAELTRSPRLLGEESASVRKDFSHSKGRASRRIRKLRDTRFAVDPATARAWCEDVLAGDLPDDRSVRDLVLLCHGNHTPSDLAGNLKEILKQAGLVADGPEPPDLFSHDRPQRVDVSGLAEAVEAACSRDTVVPGCQEFNVDRLTEQRLVRQIAFARHQLLNAIIENAALITEIISLGNRVLAGEVEPEEFTDMDIDIHDDIDAGAEFAECLQKLRDFLNHGNENSGKVRRQALQALDNLELSRSCLSDLARKTGEEVGNLVFQLLSNCDQSMEQLLIAHLPFARRETAKMAEAEEDPEELFQESYFAIRKAVERFDPERGVRFYVYAQFWIRQQISRWRMNGSSLIRVPVHRQELHAKALKYSAEFRDLHFREPMLGEVAQELGVEAKVLSSVFVALSAPLEYSAAMSMTPDPAASPEEAIHGNQRARLIRRELGDLDDRQRAIICMRFGIDRETGMTLEEIGQIYGLTRERIRQLESKALEKLGHPARARLLVDLV